MLKTGKLDSKLLESIVFSSIKYKNDEVKKRPGIGEDCAVIDFGEYDCVMSTDPITAAASQIGRLAVHISCNDIASNGIKPLGIMLAVMLPVGTTEDEISEMMRQAGEAACELEVEIIGGHTEITPAVRQPVIVSTAIGKGASKKEEEKIEPGDLIFMTKFAGLEGSGIIASDYEKDLAGVLSAAELAEAKSYLYMISVVKEGVAAGETGYTGMHDVTEGGVLGAVWELCYTAGAGAEVWQDAIPVTDVTKKICAHYNIDPLRLISSGCMVIVTRPGKKDALEKKLASLGVGVSLIGEVKKPEAGIKLSGNSTVSDVLPPDSDELYKVLANGYS